MNHAHGGDLDAIQRNYGIPKEEIIDFSGNINPLGFPEAATEALKDNLHLICTYPDKKYKALKKAIGAYTGADAAHIVCGNGSTELIATFIQTINAEKSVIMGPAYSEYEREITLNGGKFEYFPLREGEDFRLNLPALLEALTPDVGIR
ncbi:MAG: aminotransferase class I/II-fold pyridoxal phosphate-dependent enzyme, partial [Anaerotignum sp.]|nr:aminotransferase class I/II-fold pyridoxal phosphate-dependent enzyme [Anaerotignum sp.]